MVWIIGETIWIEMGLAEQGWFELNWDELNLT